MSQITEIKAKFSTLALATTGVETFMFDTLEGINTDRNKTYPVFLLKCPTSARRINLGDILSDYDIEFFIFDIHNQDDTREVEEIWDLVRGYSEGILRSLASNPNLFRIKNRSVEYNYGQFQHNDSLVGIQAKFILQVPHCYDETPSTGLTWGTWTDTWSTLTNAWNTYL